MTAHIAMSSTMMTVRDARTLITRALRQLDLRVSSASGKRSDDCAGIETEVWFVDVTDAIRLQNHLAGMRPHAEVTRNVDTRDQVIAPHRVTIRW